MRLKEVDQTPGVAVPPGVVQRVEDRAARDQRGHKRADRRRGRLEQEGVCESGAQIRERHVHQRGRSVLQHLRVQRGDTPPDLEPVSKLRILPAHVLDPDLRVHEPRRAHQDLLLDLLQFRVLRRDEDHRGGRLVVKGGHEVEQRKGHGVVASEALRREHRRCEPRRSGGPEQRGSGADVQPDAVRIAGHGEEGSEHAHG